MARLRCSFCDKQQDEVMRLIAGPGVYICDQCVRLCQEILDEGLGVGVWGAPSVDAEDLHPEPAPGQAPEVLEREVLPEALTRLSDRERHVLELRYGLDGERPRTLDEVGKAVGLTPEQVRQVENQSLAKLQAST